MTHEEAYAQDLQAMTDARLAEEVYHLFSDILRLPHVELLSPDTIRAFGWTKQKFPLAEGEVYRRGLELPRWVFADGPCGESIRNRLPPFVPPE
jgi:hypothetical protein